MNVEVVIPSPCNNLVVVFTKSGNNVNVTYFGVLLLADMPRGDALSKDMEKCAQ